MRRLAFFSVSFLSSVELRFPDQPFRDVLVHTSAILFPFMLALFY